MMTLEELADELESIEGFQNKVAYRAFPENEAPNLPFICYMVVGSNNAYADNITYLKKNEVNIELYSRLKDLVSEQLLEDKLDQLSLPYTKDEVYIDEEKCYQIVYTVEV